jgi:flagellar basal-body rod protein FlgB
MLSRLDETLNFHAQALRVREQRQQVLASNIANADTPNYKARDVDFRGALQGALNQRFAPLALATSSAAHLTSANSLPFETYTGYRVPMQASADGNTVNMDVERAAFTENSLHYEASVTFISSLLRGMRTAISGQ